MDYEIGDKVSLRESGGYQCNSNGIPVAIERRDGDAYLYRGFDLLAVLYGAA